MKFGICTCVHALRWRVRRARIGECELSMLNRALFVRSLALILLSCVAMPAVGVRDALAQSAPYTLPEVLAAVTSSRVAALDSLQGRCLAFLMTPQTQGVLRNAGASPQVLRELRETCAIVPGDAGPHRADLVFQTFTGTPRVTKSTAFIWNAWAIQLAGCQRTRGVTSCDLHFINGGDPSDGICLREALFEPIDGAASSSTKLTVARIDSSASAARDSIPMPARCVTLTGHAGTTMRVSSRTATGSTSVATEIKLTRDASAGGSHGGSRSVVLRFPAIKL